MATIRFNRSMTPEERSQTLTFSSLIESEGLYVYLEDCDGPGSMIILDGRGWLGPFSEEVEGGDTLFSTIIYPVFDETHTAWIQFVDESEDGDYYNVFINLEPTELNPIWKDKNILEGVTDSQITIGLAQWGGGSDLYRLTSYKKPGAAEQDCIVNDIISRIFTRSFPATPTEGEGTFLTSPADLVRVISWYNLANPSQTANFVFKNDWSYNREGYTITNEPIRSEIGKRQLLLSTMLSAGSDKRMFFYDADGRRFEKFLSVSGGAIGIDLAVWVSDILAAYPTAVRIEFGNASYDIVDDNCYTHALYYLNAYGGWDSLLIKGISKKKDVYERKTMQRSYRNNNPEARGLYNYANGVTTEWTLVSGWLSDEEAARMHHLLGSTSVYMMDLYTGEISPIVLTNSECEFKTYRNTGLQMVSYEITATYAQDKMRR